MNRIMMSGLLAIALAPVNARAQDREITGIVRRNDTGAPIRGVFVSIAGRIGGVCTDENGRYRLTARSGDLQVGARVVGFKPLLLSVAATAATADFRLDRAGSPSDRPLEPLIYVDGVRVSGTPSPPVEPAPWEPLIYVDGIRLSEAAPGC